jgi:hypothetical protein
MLGPAHAACGLPGADRRPAHAAHESVWPARASCPLSTLERTERAAMAERARRAASMARPAVSGYSTSHGKVFTVSTHGTRRTRLTWSRAPARSDEGRRQRGGAHRCAAVVSSGSGGQEGRPHLRELLRSRWVLRDLPRKKGGGWLGLAMVSRS